MKDYTFIVEFSNRHGYSTRFEKSTRAKNNYNAQKLVHKFIKDIYNNMDTESQKDFTTVTAYLIIPNYGCIGSCINYTSRIKFL